eukprot:15796473-Heterocapsa_arctica.AAC.1
MHTVVSCSHDWTRRYEVCSGRFSLRACDGAHPSCCLACSVLRLPLEPEAVRFVEVPADRA